MDFPCESEINVRNENALRFAIVIKPAPVIEYLKTIASLIGASHILGVFEDNNFVKVYFDDKKYVDTLIRSGIHVMGRHIKVDYVIPPGSKVILSNVDPVVSNYDLVRLMSMFGSVVSPVFRSPISDDVELCHIDHGVRYVYMNLNMPIPEVLEFKYGDQVCKINIKLDDTLPIIEYVKKEPSESNITESSSNTTASDDNIDPINVDDDVDSTDPIVVSVQSATEEINSEKQNEIIIQPNETLPHTEANNPVISKCVTIQSNETLPYTEANNPVISKCVTIQSNETPPYTKANNPVISKCVTIQSNEIPAYTEVNNPVISKCVTIQSNEIPPYTEANNPVVSKCVTIQSNETPPYYKANNPVISKCVTIQSNEIPPYTEANNPVVSKCVTIQSNETPPYTEANNSVISECDIIQSNKTLPHTKANNPVISNGDLYKTRHAKCTKTSQINKKIKRNVKDKNRRKKFKIPKKKQHIDNVTCKKESPKIPLPIQSSSSFCLSSSDDNSTLLSDISDSFINENSINVLDIDKLKLFLDEVRFLRAPIEIVKKYLGPNFDSNALLCLIKQLNDFKKETEDASSKVRIRRLINNLKSFLNA